MTTEELEVYRAAVQIYSASVRETHSEAERALLRFKAGQEANAMREHILMMDIHNISIENKIGQFLEVLTKHHGNLRRTAIEMGVTRQTIGNWRDRYAPHLKQIHMRIARPKAKSMSA